VLHVANTPAYTAAHGVTAEDMGKSGLVSLPTLWLCGSGVKTSALNNVTTMTWPTPLRQLAEFISRL
jgi:hypothetical protein